MTAVPNDDETDAQWRERSVAEQLQAAAVPKEQPAACANTDPPKVRCSWCNGRLRWEKRGYWLTCPRLGHPSHHDPRIKGWFWHLRVILGA